MAFSYHQTARIRSHYNSPTIVIIIMMIVSNQIKTGKVQYVWMAFSHQTAPRSGSSLNISQILFFLMFLFYPQNIDFSIIVQKERNIFIPLQLEQSKSCLDYELEGGIQFVFSVGLVGWYSLGIFCMGWWRVFYSRITCLTHVTYITLAFSSPHIGFSFSIFFNQMAKKQ